MFQNDKITKNGQLKYQRTRVPGCVQRYARYLPGCTGIVQHATELERRQQRPGVSSDFATGNVLRPGDRQVLGLATGDRA